MTGACIYGLNQMEKRLVMVINLLNIPAMRGDLQKMAELKAKLKNNL